MEALTIRNFRCFSEPRELVLKPLTLLVGENSTGKSSLMASLRIAWDAAFSAKRIDFNEEPFLLGAFDQIAHYRGGRGGRAQTFELGLKLPLPRSRPRRSTQSSLPFAKSPRSSDTDNFVYSGAEFGKSGSHPVIQKQVLRSKKYELTIKFPEKNGQVEFVVSSGDKTSTFSFDEEGFLFRPGSDVPVDWRFFVTSFLHEGEVRRSGQSIELSATEKGEIREIIMTTRPRSFTRPVAIAPVRTRPQRTYNPVSDTPLPEGEHIPMVLAKTFFEDKKRWESLKSALDRFGSESGLFSDLKIKALGRHESDPFQIHVKSKGPHANLIDVGYGVSQALPILVDSLLADRGSLYLLQQPEVHLHPRAQAALGSFLARLAGTQSKRFVIETHSDHFIDRIRMDIRDKKVIEPEKVSILYFERQGIHTDIHPIQIDSEGNLVDAPDDYREFFLNEERRFLGV